LTPQVGVDKLSNGLSSSLSFLADSPMFSGSGFTTDIRLMLLSTSHLTTHYLLPTDAEPHTQHLDHQNPKANPSCCTHIHDIVHTVDSGHCGRVTMSKVVKSKVGSDIVILTMPLSSFQVIVLGAL
jgi:hypothetical protein